LKEKLVEKFESTYNYYHENNCIYTEIAYIESPKDSLKRLCAILNVNANYQRK